MGEIGKLLVVVGIGFVAVGVVLVFLDRLTAGTGLPGDIVVKRENVTFVFPLATCLILSVVLTLVLNLFFRR